MAPLAFWVARVDCGSLYATGRVGRGLGLPQGLRSVCIGEGDDWFDLFDRPPRVRYAHIRALRKRSPPSRTRLARIEVFTFWMCLRTVLLLPDVTLGT